MNFPEMRKFVSWYLQEERVKGLILPIHYGFEKCGFSVTDTTISRVQCILMGVTKVSDADLLTLEAIFQMLNEVNDAVEKGHHVPRPDVF